MLAAVLEQYLKKFAPNAFVSVEFAHTCDKAKVDSFGGSMVVVTSQGSSWMSTGIDAIQGLLEDCWDGDVTALEDLQHG